MKYHIRRIATFAPRCSIRLDSAGMYILTIAAIIKRDIPSDEICKHCMNTLPVKAYTNLMDATYVRDEA